MKHIAIHSVPRSGSTWLGCIFDSSPLTAYKYQPLFSYAFKGFLDEHSSKRTINLFFEKIYGSEDRFINQIEDKNKGIVPVFRKRKDIQSVIYKEVRYHQVLENLLKKDNELIVIGLVRNPFSVINSWLKAPREFRKDLGWDELEEWRSGKSKNQLKKEEFYGFEKWKEVVKIFTLLEKKYPKRFYLLKYKDLIEDTFNTINEVFDFCDISIDEQTKKFLTDSTKTTNDNVYSVFKQKKKDDNWKKELNPKIIEYILKDITDSEFEIF